MQQSIGVFHFACLSVEFLWARRTALILLGPNRFATVWTRKAMLQDQAAGGKFYQTMLPHNCANSRLPGVTMQEAQPLRGPFRAFYEMGFESAATGHGD
jgi:hypothetical protein